MDYWMSGLVDKLLKDWGIGFGINPRIQQSIHPFCRGRGGRVVYRGGLENRFPDKLGTGVRIPPSPPTTERARLGRSNVACDWWRRVWLEPRKFRPSGGRTLLRPRRAGTVTEADPI